jgi:hypothetical protein
LLSTEKEAMIVAKRLTLLAAMLVMTVAAAVPTVAQVEQESEQDAESGEVSQSFNVTGGGGKAISAWASRASVTVVTHRTRPTSSRATLTPTTPRSRVAPP